MPIRRKLHVTEASGAPEGHKEGLIISRGLQWSVRLTVDEAVNLANDLIDTIENKENRK